MYAIKSGNASVDTLQKTVAWGRSYRTSARVPAAAAAAVVFLANGLCRSSSSVVDPI